jgi:hypothetical protein
MKLVPFLPPLLAAMTVGGMLWYQREQTQRVAEERSVLESTVQQAQAQGIKSVALRAETLAKSQAASAVTSASSQKLVLADLLAAFTETNGMPDMRAMLKFQAAMEDMTTDEIQSLLAEATTAKLTGNQQNRVLNQLLSALGKKDPKLALEEGMKLSESGSDSNLYSLRGSFESWLGKDAAAATVWLDQQIATGKMENTALMGANQKRVGFEAGIIATQLTKNPALAEARFQQLNPADRVAVLGNTWSFPITSEGQQGYVKLVRQGDLDEANQQNALSNYASTISRRGELKDVTEFLKTSEASPQETTRIVQTCASDQLRNKIGKDPQNLTAEKTSEWRNWVIQSDPEHAGSIIGKSLSGVEFGDNIIATVEAVSPPNQLDAVKQALVETASGNVTGLRTLADSITDETIRAQVLAKKWPQPQSAQEEK